MVQDKEKRECSDVQKEQIKLLMEAIRDTQGIIARLDAKARFYLAVYLAIAGGFMALIKVVVELYLKYNLYAYKVYFGIGLFFSLFILGYVIVLVILTITKVISPRNNPIERISCYEGLNKSLFYPVSQNGIFNYSEYKELLQSVDDCERIEELLLLENLKVAAIREEKMLNMYRIEKLTRIMFYILVCFVGLCFILACKVVF